MNVDSCELETIKAFVKKQKRDRYIAFLSSEKRRKEFVRNLAYFDDFDHQYIVRILPSSQNLAGIKSLLTARGAGDSCRVVSEASAFDGREMNLSEALEETIGNGMGTLLCCISGRLAYFENEDGRYILEHSSIRRTA